MLHLIIYKSVYLGVNSKKKYPSFTKGTIWLKSVEEILLCSPYGNI